MSKAETNVDVDLFGVKKRDIFISAAGVPEFKWIDGDVDKPAVALFIDHVRFSGLKVSVAKEIIKQLQGAVKDAEAEE